MYSKRCKFNISNILLAGGFFNPSFCEMFLTQSVCIKQSATEGSNVVSIHFRPIFSFYMASKHVKTLPLLLSFFPKVIESEHFKIEVINLSRTLIK